MAGAQQAHQGILVDQGTARGVDQEGAGFHLAQGGLVEEMVGGVVERQLQGDVVGLSQQGVQVHHLDSEGVCARGGSLHVFARRQDAQAEALGASGDQLPSGTEADDAQGAVGEPLDRGRFFARLGEITGAHVLLHPR